jgi:glycosyltransferase involved in cell wall biosynthesis
MSAKITIGLCVKNGARIVDSAFNSISFQDYPHSSIKVVIVNDCSSDNTLSLALNFAKKTDISTFVITSKGQGLAAARQIVVDASEGDYILWVDDDLVLSKDYVRSQVDFMDRNPKVGAAKGTNDNVLRQCLFDILSLEIHKSSAVFHQIGTGGAIFRIKALKQVNGFDIKIKGAGEDFDVSRRISESGWVLALNSSAKLHQANPPRTMNALWKSHFGYGYGLHYLLHKHSDSTFVTSFFPPIALFGGLKTARLLYDSIRKKEVFIYPLLFCFATIADSVGFVCGHLEDYGHVKRT